jgi:protein gp37
MSDLFQEKVSFSYIEGVFDVIKQAHQHTYGSRSSPAA